MCVCRFNNSIIEEDAEVYCYVFIMVAFAEVRALESWTRAAEEKSTSFKAENHRLGSNWCKILKYKSPLQCTAIRTRKFNWNWINQNKRANDSNRFTNNILTISFNLTLSQRMTHYCVIKFLNTRNMSLCILYRFSSRELPNFYDIINKWRYGNCFQNL